MSNDTYCTYLTEMSVEDGVKILLSTKKKKHNSPIARQVYLRDYKETGKIQCFSCGCIADRWIVTKVWKKNQRDSLSLFGERNGVLVQFSRDHIIPRCFGGKDDTRNLRSSCVPCNRTRSDEMTKADKAFLVKNFDLVCPDRAKDSLSRRIAALAHEKNQKIKITQIKSLLKFSCYISGYKVPDVTPYKEIWS